MSEISVCVCECDGPRGVAPGQRCHSGSTCVYRRRRGRSHSRRRRSLPTVDKEPPRQRASPRNASYRWRQEGGQRRIAAPKSSRDEDSRVTTASAANDDDDDTPKRTKPLSRSARPVRSDRGHVDRRDHRRRARAVRRAARGAHGALHRGV